jgi:hypothetical protein
LFEFLFLFTTPAKLQPVAKQSLRLSASRFILLARQNVHTKKASEHSLLDAAIFCSRQRAIGGATRQQSLQ